MNVLITLTTAGADTGPFNLYSNTDSYVTAFQTNIAKSLLVAGYTSTVVPAGTTTVRVKSTGLCTTYVDLFITGPSTTTTTTTAPIGPTTTTTTTAGGPTTTTTTTTAAPSDQWYQLTDCDTLAVDYSAMYPSSGTQFVLNQRVIDLASTIWKVTQIYTSSPGGSGLFIGPTGFTGCPGDPTTTTTTSTSTSTSSTTTTTTTATPTTTTTTTLVYYAFSLTAGGIDSATACADSSAAITLYGSNISFLSNATFYNDYTLLSPYDGSNLYYKNVANNEYVQISSIGSQTAAGSC
jgi:hypothetical protein